VPRIRLRARVAMLRAASLLAALAAIAIALEAGRRW
jgi:hypothetical protein